MYKFINAKGEEEIVQPEKWGWGVIYSDNSEFRQFDREGKFHQFREIEQERVKMLVMYQLENMSKRIDMPVKGNVQLFHFYRHFCFNFGTAEEHKTKVYVFGWKDRETGSEAYHYILPDDRIIVANHDIKNLSEFNL